MPAFAKRTSSRPKASTVCFTMPATWPELWTSTARPSARRPARAMASAADRAPSPSMSARTTAAPSAHSRSALARPIPEAAPVTMATLPWNLRDTLASLGVEVGSRKWEVGGTQANPLQVSAMGFARIEGAGQVVSACLQSDSVRSIGNSHLQAQHGAPQREVRGAGTGAGAEERPVAFDARAEVPHADQDPPDPQRAVSVLAGRSRGRPERAVGQVRAEEGQIEAVGQAELPGDAYSVGPEPASGKRSVHRQAPRLSGLDLVPDPAREEGEVDQPLGRRPPASSPIGSRRGR